MNENAMPLEIITTKGEGLLHMALPGGAIPSKGDVFQMPDGKVYVVLQRTYAFHSAKVVGVVDLAAGKPVNLTLQIVVDEVATVSIGGAPDAIPQ